MIPINISDSYEIQLNNPNQNSVALNNIDLKPIFKNYSKKKAILGIRPEYVEIANADEKGYPIKGDLKLIEPLGNETLYHIKINDINIISRRYENIFPSSEFLKKVSIKLNLHKALFFDFETKERL